MMTTRPAVINVIKTQPGTSPASSASLVLIRLPMRGVMAAWSQSAPRDASIHPHAARSTDKLSAAKGSGG